MWGALMALPTAEDALLPQAAGQACPLDTRTPRAVGTSLRFA